MEPQIIVEFFNQETESWSYLELAGDEEVAYDWSCRPSSMDDGSRRMMWLILTEITDTVGESVYFFGWLKSRFGNRSSWPSDVSKNSLDILRDTQTFWMDGKDLSEKLIRFSGSVTHKHVLYIFSLLLFIRIAEDCDLLPEQIRFIFSEEK